MPCPAQMLAKVSAARRRFRSGVLPADGFPEYGCRRTRRHSSASSLSSSKVLAFAVVKNNKIRTNYLIYTKRSSGHSLAFSENVSFRTPRSLGIDFVAFLLFASALLLTLPCQAQTAKGNGYAAYTTAAKDAKPPQKPRPGVVMLGGNGDVDEATQFLCEHSGGGEIVVLRASGADEYNSDFHDACPANSVTSLVITSADGARDPYVAKAIREAHAIFISGGDQSNYVKFWCGNPV